MAFELTPQQMMFYKTFGFLAFPGLLKDRIGRVIEEFEEVWKTQGGGHAGQKHEGKKRSCIVPFLDQNEYLSSLLDDERIHAIAAGLLGDDFNYMASDGNYYAGDTGWHSDGWHRDVLHAKIAFYLDPLTRDTGALRVIPGSHVVGDKYAEALHANVGKSQEVWGIGGAEVPAAALETRPGDILVFNHNTKHASFGGGGWRRMFTINLCTRYPAGREQELRDYISHWSRFWMERGYGEAMIRTAGPGRMRHLEQVLANDGHLAGLSRAAREKMLEPSRG